MATVTNRRRTDAMHAEVLLDLGYGRLTDSQAKDLWLHVVRTLEVSVGTRVASRFNDRQMDAFEASVDAGDARQGIALIEQLAPNYREVLAKEYNEIVSVLEQVGRQHRART